MQRLSDARGREALTTEHLLPFLHPLFGPLHLALVLRLTPKLPGRRIATGRAETSHGARGCRSDSLLSRAPLRCAADTRSPVSIALARRPSPQRFATPEL